ncbi:protein IQ-DOMAIN 6-like [Primulina huaijiensis]|uniref:protein IQ-DOMAIN 6-like n=1 Tax=Primulina huaijiensis TaxID=1492673 RepID=UPI003CC7344E
MGASGKWVKALIGLKKPAKDDYYEKLGEKSSKWRLWRKSSLGDFGASSWKSFRRNGRFVGGSECSFDSMSLKNNNDAFTAAVAALIVFYWTLQDGWCGSRGTLEEIKAKIHMRQEGAFKRERAIAYSLAQKQQKSSQSIDSRVKNNQLDKKSWGWSWLERWMAAKPWETRLMEQSNKHASCKTPLSKTSIESTKRNIHPRSAEPTLVKVRKNNISTRISAKPPPILGEAANHSSSSPSSDFRHEESSTSSSIITTPISRNNVTSDITEDSNNNYNKRSYMNLTEATKAKQKINRVKKKSMEEFQFLQKSMACRKPSDGRSRV